MIALVTKPRVLFVPYSETPDSPNYHEAVWDDDAEQWRVPPTVNTIHGVLPSGTINWRTQDQEGNFQANEAAPKQSGRMNILQGIRDGEVVKQSANVRIEGHALNVAPDFGRFT